MATESELKDIAQAQSSGDPQPGTIWRHYKGGLYVIVCRSLQEDTLEDLVTYRSLSNPEGVFWTRTVANFTARVQLPDETGQVRVVDESRIVARFTRWSA